MWEFMCNYAENFWTGTEYAWEIFEVIMAWAITLGVAGFVAVVIFYVLLALAELMMNIKDRGN